MSFDDEAISFDPDEISNEINEDSPSIDTSSQDSNEPDADAIAQEMVQQNPLTENKIDEIGGKRNTTNQANIIMNFNYNIDSNHDTASPLDIFNDLYIKGFFEKDFLKSRDGFSPISKEKRDYSLSDILQKLPDSQASTEERFRESIEDSSNDTAYINPSRNQQQTNNTRKLPQNEEEIEHWYYKELSEIDRCFVKACAVLHGSSLNAIADATREFLELLKEETNADMSQTLQTVLLPDEPETPPDSLPEALLPAYLMGRQDERERKIYAHVEIQKGTSSTSLAAQFSPGSISSLLERTHTYTLWVNHATRLFWKDADNNGLSSFSVDILRFLAREATMENILGVQQGRRFTDIVREWPTRYRGERSWRSANALGVVWWYQDARNLLWRQADKWARGQQKQDWEHAAALLDGAYQVEHESIKQGTVMTSSVLQLLDRWIATSRQATTHRGEGHAAARAFDLIGRKSPEIALNGLKQLLHISLSPIVPTAKRPYLGDLFISSTIKYVNIARAGHVRLVLKHLADGAYHSIQEKADSSRRNSHAAATHVELTAFLLLTSCSLSSVDTSFTAIYAASEPLPDSPPCPDNKGRDILLAGFLTTAEEEWYERLAILLASVIINKNYSAAFYLLSRWGEIVLKDQSKNASVFVDRYIQFLVKIGQLIIAWSARHRTARHIAIGAYRRRLTLWLTDRRLPHENFKVIARKVLDQLPSAN